MAADVLKFKLADVPENLNEASGKGYASAGIREGRKRERAEQEAKAKETAIQHAGELKGIKSAHVDELNRVTAVARATGFWRGVSIGGVIIGSIVGTALAIYAAAIINPAFDAAARMQMQQGVMETVQRSAEP